jgi:hypothetical protein
MLNDTDTNIIINDKDERTKYLEELSEIERKVIIIGEEVLGSSFNIGRSLGFIKWKNNKMEK